MSSTKDNLAKSRTDQAALEAEKRQAERELIALEDRTMDAFKEEEFQEKHFEIVNTIMTDGSNEIENDYPEENLRQIRHVMAKAIEQSSNAFRKFSGEDALPVYKYKKSKQRDYEIPPEIYEQVLGKKKTIKKIVEPTKKQLKEKTPEYAEVLEITGPISAEFAQELLDVAGLDEVDASELIHKLSFTDLLEYSYKKITGSEEDLSAVTQEEIEAIISEVVPEEKRWDFDNEVIASINYNQGEKLSDAEKKAMDLLFILMNQLWKVQQVHRATFEDADHRISSRENVDYQTYEGYLSDSNDQHSDKSPLHGLVFASYGVQKDVMIYLRN